jgi:hypothetical protein
MKLFHLRFIDLKDVDAFLWAGMKRAAATLLALVALILPVFAATPNIQVKIQHFSATAPLDDQPVRLEAMAVASPVAVQRGFTDTDGQITFSSMPAGRYKLFLFHVPALELVIPDTSGTVQASSYVVTEGWTIATADDAGVIDLQSTQVLLLGNGLTKAGNTLQLSENVALDGSLSLSGETNRLTVAGDALLLDGSAIGGDTIWNNTDGAIAPASGQDTNVLRFTSGLADNSTNKAVAVDTASAWQNGALLSLSTGGSSVYSFGPGGLVMGLQGGSGFAQFTSMTGDGHKSWELYSNTNVAYFGLGRFASDVYLNPNADDGNTIHTLSSSQSLSTGTLLAVQNNWTNKFAVLPSGAVSAARSPAEPAAPDAGYFTLFGIDNGGGKMILKVRFPTGASQTIATEP